MSIYVITHKEFNAPIDSFYRTLLVGAYKGHKFSALFDDDGENISKKNTTFCELTGVYWVWKHVKDDVIGIVHYRRYFSKTINNHSILTEKDITNKLNNYDVIVPNRVYLPQTLEDQFKNSFTQTELDLIERAIIKNSPEYLTTYSEIMKGHSIFFCNMMISKKKLYDQYCEWLFPILFDIESNVDMTGFNSYQMRLFGFISERLLTVWIAHNHLKTCELGMINTESKDSPFKSLIKGLRRPISFYCPNFRGIDKIIKRKRINEVKV